MTDFPEFFVSESDKMAFTHCGREFVDMLVARINIADKEDRVGLVEKKRLTGFENKG